MYKLSISVLCTNEAFSDFYVACTVLNVLIYIFLSKKMLYVQENCIRPVFKVSSESLEKPGIEPTDDPWPMLQKLVSGLKCLMWSHILFSL